MDDGRVEGLMVKYAGGLMPWQRTLMRELLGGVCVKTLRGRGRRAGYTTMLQRLEEALKDRDSVYLWDESLMPPEAR